MGEPPLASRVCRVDLKGMNISPEGVAIVKTRLNRVSLLRLIAMTLGP